MVIVQKQNGRDKMNTGHRFRILRHLRHQGSITSWEAIKEYGVTRLSAVIFDLRQIGWNITDDWELFTNRYGELTRFKRYYLKGKKK